MKKVILTTGERVAEQCGWGRTPTARDGKMRKAWAPAGQYRIQKAAGKPWHFSGVHSFKVQVRNWGCKALIFDLQHYFKLPSKQTDNNI